MNRDDSGLALGVQAGRAYRWLDRPRTQLLFSPTFGLQGAAYRSDRSSVWGGERTGLLGLVGGASLALRSNNYDGTMLVMGAELAYVHWMGIIADRSVGWLGAGFMGNLFMAWYL